MTVEEFLERLDQVRQSGSERKWSACCPAHDDRSPSLSIKEAEDRRILLHCHAGCPPEAIVEAMSLTMADLFPRRNTGGQREAPELVRALGTLRLRVAGHRVGALGARLAVIADVQGLQVLRGEVAGWDDKDLSKFAARLLETFAAEDRRPVTAAEIVGALRGLHDDARARADAARNGARQREKAKAEDLQGQPLLLADPEPWEEEVDGAGLLDAIEATIRRYVAMPKGGAAAAALWAVHTHALDAASISPILALTSPQKRCGKSSLLIVLSNLVRRPVFNSNVTPATVFRVVEAFAPTVFLDEFDKAANKDEDLWGVVNAGHHRATAYVIRAVGEDHTPRLFRTWAPKAVALLKTLPPTVADRSIQIRMRRRAPGEEVERLRLDRLAAELDPLRRQAARWAADHLEALRESDPVLPPALHDREQDNWRPLVSIAVKAGGAWPEKARGAALALSGAVDVEDEGDGVLLLADLRDVFREREADWLPTAEILGDLTAKADHPWAEWSNGKKMTPHALAKLLRPFGIRVSRRGRVDRGYGAAAFADAWARYLSSPGEVPPSDACAASQENPGVSDETPFAAADTDGGCDFDGRPRNDCIASDASDAPHREREGEKARLVPDLAAWGLPPEADEAAAEDPGEVSPEEPGAGDDEDPFRLPAEDGR